MNSMFYNCLNDACVQCDDLQSATGYFDQMKQLKFVDGVNYTTMLKEHLALGRFQQARIVAGNEGARVAYQ